MSDPLRQLAALATLPDGWDSYGARPIAPAATEEARRLLWLMDDPSQAPSVVPTSRGGVQLEWAHPHGLGSEVEIEIGPDGRIIGLWVML